MGVFYNRDSFLGIWSRFAIGLIDLFAVGWVWFLLGAIPGNFLPIKIGSVYSIFSLLGIMFTYFVILKRTDFRTIGYRVFQVRVVDLHGNRPSIFSMVNRFSFMLLGPLNGIIDLLWITSDDSKQALRDRWSGTYVVKTEAEPLGTGPIVTMRYEILGLNLVFREVSLQGGRTP
jgi:uncharacterized RDD family membrane protein YckC